MASYGVIWGRRNARSPTTTRTPVPPFRVGRPIRRGLAESAMAKSNSPSIDRKALGRKNNPRIA
jgi:hypothetical protein